MTIPAWVMIACTFLCELSVSALQLHTYKFFTYMYELPFVIANIHVMTFMYDN